MNPPPSPPRVDPAMLDTMAGARIEFAIVHGTRRVCGFGTLHIRIHHEIRTFIIRRLGSFRNGRFEVEEYPIPPLLARWIRIHSDPSIARLSLYEPRSSALLLAGG